jgi:hypothetical protein
VTEALTFERFSLAVFNSCPYGRMIIDPVLVRRLYDFCRNAARLNLPEECSISSECTIVRIVGALFDEKLVLSALCASLYAVSWLAVFSILIWMPSSFLWSRCLTRS